MGAPTLQTKILSTRWSCLVVFKVQKNSHHKIQTAMVRAVPNPILFPQQHHFVGHHKQIWSTPHPCKCKQVQALLTLWGFPRTGIKGGQGGEGGESQWTIGMEWRQPTGINGRQPIGSGGRQTIGSRHSFDCSSTIIVLRQGIKIKWALSYFEKTTGNGSSGYYFTKRFF